MHFSRVAVRGTSDPEEDQVSSDRDRADLMPPASLAGTLVVAEDRNLAASKEPEDRLEAMTGICCV